MYGMKIEDEVGRGWLLELRKMMRRVLDMLSERSLWVFKGGV